MWNRQALSCRLKVCSVIYGLHREDCSTESARDSEAPTYTSHDHRGSTGLTTATINMAAANFVVITTGNN